MAGVPSSVAQAAEQADQRIAESTQPDTDTGPADDVDVAPPQPLNQPEPANEPAPAEQADEGRPSESGDAQQDTESWEQKYKVLQGKYNAEIPRLQQQVKDLQEHNQALQQQLQQAPANTGEAPPAPTGDLNLEPIREDFGDDFVKPIEQMAQRNQQLESSLQQMQQRLEQLEGTQKQDREQDFWDELERAVADWRTINADQAFHSWLAEVEPKAGKTRQEMLDEAANALNANRVIAIFNEFKQGQQTQGQSRQQERQRSMEAQVEPASTPSNTTPDQKPVYAHSDIQRWYDDAAKKLMPDKKPDEYKKWDYEFTQAYAEGRVDRSR